MISQDSLKKLVDEFSAPKPEFDGKSYVTRRRDWFDVPMGRVRPLLMRDHLAQLTEEEAAKIYNEMTVGGPRLYPRTYIENGVEKIRAALAYLLYGTDDLATRFYNVAGNPDSEYRLNGVGKAFASTALLLVDHSQYGIWNSAVDGGLKLLDMLPKRRPGAHLGEQYLAILESLKRLQAMCGFEDMSVTDEFVELIFHEKIGTEISKTGGRELEQAAEAEEEAAGEPAEETTHTRIQYLLVKIGGMRSYDVWVASNDRGRLYRGEALAGMSLEELPHFAGPTSLRVAKAIDVIWFKKRTAQPVAFFEIEHTTSIYSGLLRLNDVKTDYPIPRAYIVAPKERKALFEGQLQRRTFAQSELGDICQFLSYEEVENLLKSHEAIATILP